LRRMSRTDTFFAHGGAGAHARRRDDAITVTGAHAIALNF